MEFIPNLSNSDNLTLSELLFSTDSISTLDIFLTESTECELSSNSFGSVVDDSTSLSAINTEGKTLVPFVTNWVIGMGC